MIDAAKIKKDFPILGNDPALVYLDSAAMSLKPASVISAVTAYYEKYSANVFRGIYKISEKATREYERTREAVARFINAKSSKEVIFVRNTTEAVNLVAYSWGKGHIDERCEIVTTVMEHHSNFVPWQQLAFENGATLKIMDIDGQGYLQTDDLDTIITGKTKLLAITYVSNALGTINPLKEIIANAKRQNPGIMVMVDAAQAIPHLTVDVQELGCDFLVFSGQKMLGPTGAGVLWARQEILEAMPPFLFGGEMINEVHMDRTVFAPLPHKFEAGTPHIAGVIGLGAAVEYLARMGMDAVREHEKQLLIYALDRMRNFKGLTVYGPGDIDRRGAVITFTVDKIHPHDVAQILDESNICVRAGHHCAMPLHDRLKLEATVRASLYLYNTADDIDKLLIALEKAKRVFS